MFFLDRGADFGWISRLRLAA